ncbi:MAG: oligosaccharide flippase family protein [Muribaculaceae bacterium]
MSRRGTNISRMVVKAMGLFSGVQMLSILCSVVRCKLVAMWIGPVGVGLFALWNSALDMIGTASNLGIRSTSVRSIAMESAKGDEKKISRMAVVVRRWSMWLGLGGALFTAALAPVLSSITFGDDRHIWGFVFLSVAVLTNSLMNGEHALLQGTAMLRRLASASVTGSVAGLALSVPMFYYLRVDSVLPSVILCSIVAAVCAYIFRKKDCSPQPVSRTEVVKQGGEFVRLGIYMTIGVVLSLITNYVFMAYLNSRGGTEEVGFYQAGYTLVNKYVGLVLTALGMEFYPRLSRVSHSKHGMALFTSQEINITLFLLTPLVMIMMLLRKPVVCLLYETEFLVVLPCLTWMLVGMVLRATSWCMAYVILVRGDGKTFVITEALSVSVGLALNIASYHYYGLVGLGVSYTIWYAAYNVIIGVVYFGRYRMKLHGSVFANALFAVALSVCCAFAVGREAYLVATVLTVAASATCLWLLFKLLRSKPIDKT